MVKEVDLAKPYTRSHWQIKRLILHHYIYLINLKWIFLIVELLVLVKKQKNIKHKRILQEIHLLLRWKIYSSASSINYSCGQTAI
ncbi:hypothetical protein F518_02654 [Serratia marcescens VGH107]|nr:hypothetical protein F518_02654 [Serratia marcescens VGH107]